MKFQLMGLVQFNESGPPSERMEVRTINEVFRVRPSPKAQLMGARRAHKILQEYHRRFHKKRNYSLHAQFFRLNLYATARSEMRSGKSCLDWLSS